MTYDSFRVSVTVDYFFTKSNPDAWCVPVNTKPTLELYRYKLRGLFEKFVALCFKSNMLCQIFLKYCHALAFTTLSYKL